MPLVTALVYDITAHNTLGATTFDLPTVHSRDRITGTTHYVSRLEQTALFAGGPGFDDSAATSLTPTGTTASTSPDHVLTTSTFAERRWSPSRRFGSRVQTGVTSFTYSGTSPSSAFAQQRIVGFYRDASWTELFRAADLPLRYRERGLHRAVDECPGLAGPDL